jgi:hypothetical protein
VLKSQAVYVCVTDDGPCDGRSPKSLPVRVDGELCGKAGGNWTMRSGLCRERAAVGRAVQDRLKGGM